MSKKIIALFVILWLVFVPAAQCSAWEGESSVSEAVNTLTSLINVWGSLFSKMTGVYGIMENAGNLSSFVASVSDFISSGNTLYDIVERVLSWLGINVEDGEDDGVDPNDDIEESPDGSYSI